MQTLQSSKLILYCLFYFLCLNVQVNVFADVYLQMPRGSNDRFNEANRDRDNGNRLFDSQNNERGGYNVGTMYYYAGTTVPIEWTAQHSCGDVGRANCEVIIQMMCSDFTPASASAPSSGPLRDGSDTGTIPTNRNLCYNYNCDTDLRFGRHESYDYYYQCRQRMRNTGLFTADQNLGTNTGAQRTRQNPNGDRHGYECTEERDYFPYWAPSPWIDVAYFTNQPQRCAAIQQASQNVSPRYYCVPPPALRAQRMEDEGWVPITAAGCSALSYFNAALNITQRGQWTQVPAFNVNPPFCIENAWSRDNHHGNINGGFPQMWNWTVPSNIVSENCALRLRYNISTTDLSYWTGPDTVSPTLNSTYNSRPNPNPQVDPAAVPLWLNFSLTSADVPEVAASLSSSGSTSATQQAAQMSRQYVLKNNPQVDPFGFAGSPLRFQLAINTAQYGRLFQDRTHRFAIRSRPQSIPSTANIKLLSVRGKRGNIVQVYPAVEYDFHPNRLLVGVNDYIHIQWTGSNTNPDNNAGEGKEGTDRSNIVSVRNKNFNDGQPGWLGPGGLAQTSPSTYGSYANYYPDLITNASSSTSFLGLSYTDLQALAVLNTAQYGGSMAQLDDAGTYFDLGPRQMSTQGIFHYLCTRNNNFSNRNQVGRVVVSSSSPVIADVGFNGGVVLDGASSVTIPQGALSGLTTVTLEVISRSANDGAPGTSPIVAVSLGGSAASTPLTVQVPMSRPGPSPLVNTQMYVAQSRNGPWSTTSADFSQSSFASTSSSSGGYYTVDAQLNGGAIAGIVLATVIGVGAIVAVIVVVYRKRKAGTGASPNANASAVVPPGPGVASV